MEPHAPRLTRTPAGPRPARAGLGVAVLLLAAPGCVLADKCRTCGKSAPPKPSPDCCQVVTTWSNKVHYAPDPTKGGTPAPGLAGRMYLFGPQIDFPQVGDGTVLVELFDDAGPQPGGVLIEQWALDKDMLRKLLMKDTIGWGYTLFLPWGTYHPERTKVHLNVRYDPDKGGPLYAPSPPMVLAHEPPDAGLATASATAPAAPTLPMPKSMN